MPIHTCKYVIGRNKCIKYILLKWVFYDRPSYALGTLRITFAKWSYTNDSILFTLRIREISLRNYSYLKHSDTSWYILYIKLLYKYIKYVKLISNKRMVIILGSLVFSCTKTATNMTPSLTEMNFSWMTITKKELIICWPIPFLRAF